MRLRDHARAALAHEHVLPFAEADGDALSRRAYGAVCHKLPVLVHTSGLTAALHFVAGRSKPAQRDLLWQLAAQLSDGGLLSLPAAPKGEKAEEARQRMAEALLKASREADLAQIQALTQETQRCLLWYKRFVKSVLRVDAADDGGDE